MQEGLDYVRAALAGCYPDCVVIRRRRVVLRCISKQRAEYRQHLKYRFAVGADWLCILHEAVGKVVEVV